MSTQGIIYISELDENGKLKKIVCKRCGKTFKDGDYYMRHLHSCKVKYKPRQTYDDMRDRK